MFGTTLDRVEAEADNEGGERRLAMDVIDMKQTVRRPSLPQNDSDTQIDSCPQEEQEDMRDEYDFSESGPNPYCGRGRRR